MNDAERRSSPRLDTRSAVVLSTEPGSLAGHTFNISHRGVFVSVKGQISIRLTFEGHEFHGRLVHATTSGQDTVCGIQLDTPIGVAA